MLILTNVELSISDYKVTVKAGALINVSDEVGKKIIKAGYGVKKEIEDLEPVETEEEDLEPVETEEDLEITEEETTKSKDDLTVAEIKEFLDKEGIKYDSKSKKDELLKLLPF